MSESEIINTGPSGFGASYYDEFTRCPLRWARTHVANLRAPKTLPLIRGSILHVGLAHHYQRLKEGAGEGEAKAMPPHAAMAVAAEEYGETGPQILPTVAACFDAYVARYGAERFEIVDVEKKFETSFGAAPYTARVDLVVKDSGGRTWFYDHKGVFRIEGKSVKRYTLSLQILGLAYLGHLHYGAEFGGVRLNYLGFETPFEFDRRSPDPAPWAVSRFPSGVEQLWLRMQKMRERLGTDAEKYPPHFSEQICMGPYGPCEYFDRCCWGT